MAIAAVHPSMYASMGIIALILWRLYARIRRVIGRQTFSARRTWMMLVVFPALMVLLLVLSLAHPPNAIYLCAGAAGGGLLGMLGLRLTRFEVTEAGHFYTPNAHLGILLTLLFVGRIAYRFVHLQFFGDAAVGPPTTLVRSPLTLLIFATMAGYYVAYAVGLLRWAATSTGAGGATSTRSPDASSAASSSNHQPESVQDHDKRRTSDP
jgi:hypothetical protein